MKTQQHGFVQPTMMSPGVTYRFAGYSVHPTIRELRRPGC